MKLPSIENYLLYIFLAVVILAGLYFILNYSTGSIYKSIFPTSVSPSPLVTSSKFSDIVPSSPDDVPGCPNVLIRKGNLLLLIDTHSPPETGKNPVIFKNLEEYRDYIKSQREMGKKSCPILFLQEETNAQGDDVYRVRPGPFDQQNNGTPGSSMKISEISGIQQFFKEQPKKDAAPAFVDSAAPSSFNKVAKTGTSSSPSVNPNSNLGSGPKDSNNGKLTRVENISVDNYDTTQKSVFKPANLSSPMGVTNSSVFKTTALIEGMQPGAQPGIPTPLSTATSVAPPPPMYNLGPGSTSLPIPQSASGQGNQSITQGSITGPITTAAIYPPVQQGPNPIKTPYFNGSLGPYVGSGSNLQQSLQGSSPVPPMSVTPFVDASRMDSPYNQNQYTGFDPYGQFIGKYTNVDQVHDSTATPKMSDNPMDPNWGGVLYTRDQVNSGKYDENIVQKPVYGGSVNVTAIPSLMPNGGIPIYVDRAVKPASCGDQVKMSTRTLRSSPENA